MAHMLRQAYLYRGRVYQPGDPLPDDVAAALEARGAFETPVKEVVTSNVATNPEPDAMQLSDEVATGKASPDAPRRFEREENAVTELMTVNGIGEEIARVLVRKGVLTRDDLARMDDERLQGVPGIGPATLKRIRKQLED